MLNFLPGVILFPVSFFCFALNLTFWGVIVTSFGILKLLLPFDSVHRLLSGPAHACYRGWSLLNGLLIQLFNPVEWQISGANGLNQHTWYLLISNHKSWLDIPVLGWFALGRIPEPKFFLKEELKWVPFIGSGSWALDMPFMKRYSQATLAKKPHLKGKDIETTQKSCEKFKHKPTTIINFVEGTRFTEQKQQRSNSPFGHLLAPKAGGIAFTLASMGQQFDAILDITLIYPDNPGHIVLDMLMGRLKRVVIQVDVIAVDQQVIGDYFNNGQFRVNFQQWLNQRWQQKDQRIACFYAKENTNKGLNNSYVN
ncbi:acyltransferase [Chromatiaceae bacterium AAb-1]|nr:acyltransferase [Chromatiaceae bacterium AAb-1]